MSGSVRKSTTTVIAIMISAPQANGSGATKNQDASTSELAFESSWPVGCRWCQDSGRRRY